MMSVLFTLIPAVSLKIHEWPSISIRTSTISLKQRINHQPTYFITLQYLVVPAMGETIAAGLRARAFNKEDFPIKSVSFRYAAMQEERE